jgi:hypothetical protein
MRFAACPVFPALPDELKRTGEPPQAAKRMHRHAGSLWKLETV